MTEENKSEKYINVLQYTNGFVSPIKIFPGPQGGAYLEQELPIILGQYKDEDPTILIYEIKNVREVKLSEIKGYEVKECDKPKTEECKGCPSHNKK